jgi:hypothetical protein
MTTNHIPTMRTCKIIPIFALLLQFLICSKVYADTNSAPAYYGGLPVLSEPQQTTISKPQYNPLAGPDYPIAQDSYFTDDSGNILMYVKILGEVNRQGPMVVRESADFAEIIANAQGVKQNADLRKVIVARQKPDEKGQQAYIVDIKKFFKEGDRSMFIALKPNDTIIIPEKGLSLDKLAKISSIIYPWASVYTLYETRK